MNKTNKIMIVAENVTVLNLYQNILNAENYEIQSCNDLTQSLEITNNFCPDLVLWYLELEKENIILDILKQLRQKCNNCRLPIIILTVPTDYNGYTFKGLVNEIIEALFDPDWFLMFIKNLLE